jgi:hypothetical protein
VQLAGGGVGLLIHQLPQPLQVDLDDGDAAARARGGLAVLAAPLHHAPYPGRTHLKQARHSLGGKALITGGDDAVTQILRVGSAHPCGS